MSLCPRRLQGECTSMAHFSWAPVSSLHSTVPKANCCGARSVATCACRRAWAYSPVVCMVQLGSCYESVALDVTGQESSRCQTSPGIAPRQLEVARRKSMYKAGRIFFFWLVLALTTVGCEFQPEGNTGSIQFAVSLGQSLSASDVARMTVTSSGPDIPSVTQELTLTSGKWGGVVTDVPTGTDRSFLAQAYNSSGTLLYKGQSSGVTINASQTTLVAITLLEVTPPSPFSNEAPIIGSVVASPTTVQIGKTVSLNASASDPNPTDTLSYAWTATAGSFSKASEASTTWTAPTTVGISSLTLVVTDSQGTAAAVTISINVINGADEGRAALDVQVNNHPVVSRVSSSSARVNVGQAATVTVSASDSDSDPLTYQWSASCSGSWTSATSNTAIFTPSSLPSGACNNCQLTVAVSDGRGGKNTGKLNLCVVSTSTTRFPPSIIRAYQSSSTASPSQSLSFQVEARDPQSSTLSFQWSANAGLMGTATSGATSSSNTWTAPTCVPSGTTLSITATATNGYGLSDSTTFQVSGLPSCTPSTGGKTLLNYTGADQSWKVPTGVNRIRVKLWGAGGGGTTFSTGGYGGGGAFADAFLGVSPGETLTVVVGGGGALGPSSSTSVAAYGGGGAPGVQNGAGGGGRSAIRRSTYDYATAGGGGGAGADADGTYSDGGPGGLTGRDGKDGATTDGTYGLRGRGGSSSAGGAGGSSVGATFSAQAGTQYKGGDASTEWWSGDGGGGGGGYYGGGAGGGDTSGGAGGGGGGGSSYAPNGSVLDGSGRNAGGMLDSDYVTGVGMGGQGGSAGGHGRVVIYSDVEQYPLSNAMKCSTRPRLNLANGQLACYGIWDYGNSFGEDMDMCEDYSTPKTGCVVSTPVCTSGKATAVEYIGISSATSTQLSTIATNLGVSTQLLKEGMARVYVYNCSP